MKVKTEEHKAEDLSQELYNYGATIIKRANNLPCSGLYLHGKNNILNGLGGTMQLYGLANFNIDEVNTMMIKSIANSELKLGNLELELRKNKASSDLNIMKLQDKYEWWS